MKTLTNSEDVACQRHPEGEVVSGKSTGKLEDSLVRGTRRFMEGMESTPILEDSKWAWHPEGRS